ncbi:MAG: double-strand break repair helicase AddA [Alphaproteobacteria bacterium]|nr:double-strand break repair helicase AddA [Alphaproteobacteria bacterium]
MNISAVPEQLYQLTQANQRRAANPRASAWVAASAGSGKTKVLTDRVLSLLLAGVAPQRILCLTFTKAAAAEMAQRINAELGDWAIADTQELAAKLEALSRGQVDAVQIGRARRLFAQVLDVPDGMKIMTIHAFCQSVLRRFPIEAEVVPHFAVMDERDSNELLEAVQLELMVRAQADDGALAASVADITSRIHETRFPDLMAELTAARGRIADLIARHGGVDPLVAAIYGALGLQDGETPDSIIGAACDAESFDDEALHRAANALSQGSAADQNRAADIGRWLAKPDTRNRLFENYCAVFLTKDGQVRKTLITKSALASDAQAGDILATEAARIHNTQARLHSANIGHATAVLIRVAHALIESYTQHKSARALLDYDDLIIRTRQLLQAEGRAAWVLFKLDGGIDHILIDEAQDTNPDQWRVVAALADEFFAGFGLRDEALEDAGLPKRSVFAVGDVKQSIYSFQGAEPQAFEGMRRYFNNRALDAERGWEDVRLDVSFRSTGPVLQAVDAVFAHAPARTGVVDGEDLLQHLPIRAGAGGCVEIWPPLKPIGPPEPEPWKPPVERVSVAGARERLAGLVARRIAAWVHNGDILESKGRAIEPSDIMILVRRRGPFVEALVRALKDSDVAVAGVDRMVLNEQLAVMDLLALGEFLLLPEDDLTLATVLKGPLLGLLDDDLFDLAHQRDGSIWQTLRRRAAEDPRFGRAHDYLSRLLGEVDFLRPYELYAQLLNRGGRAAILSRLGPDAADPLDEFLSLALAYERTNTPSLQGFLHWMATGRAEVKRDLEQASGAVRVMTVHGAKGLQAPIVILPDTMQVPVGSPQLLWPETGGIMLWAPRADDRDEVAGAAYERARQLQAEEYRRLLYVAMTRAGDRLYICGWETARGAPEDCWYRLIQDAMESVAQPVESSFLANDSEAIDSTILRLQSAQHDAPVAETAPQRRVDAPPLPDWASEPAPAEPTPSRPLAPSHAEHDPPVRSPLDADDDLNRFKRGTIIHYLLQWLPGLSPEHRAAAAHNYLARPTLELSDDAQERLATEALAVLEDEALSGLFSPASLAEVPISGVVSGGHGREQVVSGQIDRLLIADGTVTVVDYKSNRPPPQTPADVQPVYLRQMAAYRALLADAYPGFAINCCLLWTDGPRLMALPNTLLDRHSGISPTPA